ncbi:MAG: NUDIX domain-containing protein [Anaerolineae bacterium]|nr:NUDIX domain-containing protein [Anaerolineae bacterium]
MVKLLTGKRAGKDGKIAVGCSAAVFDDNHERILLIHRADNAKWAVPGGYMEAGEDFTEACVREVFEETGLAVKVQHLIGVYTNPHILLEYPDGNRWQLVILHFEAKMIGGELRPSEESPEVRFCTPEEAATLAMRPIDRLRIADALANQEGAILRKEFGV